MSQVAAGDPEPQAKMPMLKAEGIVVRHKGSSIAEKQDGGFLCVVMRHYEPSELSRA